MGSRDYRRATSTVALHAEVSVITGLPMSIVLVMEWDGNI